MGRTSATVKNRYAAKAYDRIVTLVPKGQKQAIEAFARGRSESVNSLFNRLVRGEMGVSEDDWRAIPNADTLTAQPSAPAADPVATEPPKRKRGRPRKNQPTQQQGNT